MSNSFSELFRPSKISQLIGDDQKKIAEGLLKQIESGTYAQEIMFIGPTGVGKTTLVRICSAAINPEAFIEEINCGDDTGVDNIRDFIQSMRYYPVDGGKAIYHLAEIHNLTKNAQEALLTQIEPVPDHVVLFASTTDPDKVLPTLRGRFDKYYLTTPSEQWFRKKAGWICDSKQQSLEPSIIDQIIGSSNGSVREFDKYMQQALAGTYKVIALEVEDTKGLLNMMLYQNVLLQDWFEAAAKETDYLGFTVGICNYCIKMLSNKRLQHNHFMRAQFILGILGKGLSRDISAKVSFHQKLLEIYIEFQHAKV